VHGAIFSIYERLLYRSCSAFVGWTPYLAGLALQLGAPRAVTIEGAVDLDVFAPVSDAQRALFRRRYGLAPDHLVCGVVGSIQWSERQQYCYGLELVETLKYLRRTDVSVLIVGDGDGRAELERRVSADLADRVAFTGRVAPEEVVDTLNTMDIGFITQTLDGLGSFRLTTKLPEYLATGLPVAMSPIPGYFDYVGDAAGWSLPPYHPASEEFHRACARWLDGLDRDDVYTKRSAAHRIAANQFAYPLITRRFATFMADLLDLEKPLKSIQIRTETPTA
jgi:glycosyltransferase involved in cell wall biosynthesis